jgi:hypothetical protein
MSEHDPDCDGCGYCYDSSFDDEADEPTLFGNITKILLAVGVIFFLFRGC